MQRLQHLASEAPRIMSNEEERHELFIALLGAVDAEDLEVQQQILTAHPELLAMSDLEGRTALHRAAGRGAALSLTHLISLSPDLGIANVRSNSKRSPMHFSASIGSIPCIEALFKSGASIDVQDSNGITPLMDACKAGHADTVRYLLKSCDASVYTCLHVLAACSALPPPVLQRLLSALLPVLTEQDLDAKNSEDETPLSLAQKLGNDAVAKALKNFGTRPQPLARLAGAVSAAAVQAAPASSALHHTEDCDESTEPARICFPDFTYSCDSSSSDRAHVLSRRLLQIARKMMQTSLGGMAPLMRQALLEWNSCMSQYQEVIHAQVHAPLMIVAASGALVNSSGHTLLSLAAVSGCAQSVVNCFDAGNQAATRDHDGQHALQLALMSHTLSKAADAPPNPAPTHTLVSSKRLAFEECFHLPPSARTFAAAAVAAIEGLLASAPSLVRRTATIARERLDIVKTLSERLVLAQLTSCDKFGLDVAATAVAFGSIDCISFLLMDRSLPHNQTIKLLVHNDDSYVIQDLPAPSRHVTVSLLHIAALRGDATIIRLLCRINPSSVNAVSGEGMTALHYAIAARSALSSIDALLAHGADPAIECGGTNAFVLAGCIYSEVLELLAMHAPVSRRNIATTTGDDSDLEDAAGTRDSNEPRKDTKSTIFEATSHGDSTVVGRLLKGGFDIESRNDSGQTLLMVACACGHRPVVKRILKHGADMDAMDLNGKTAAHIALQRGRQELCEYLLACGASQDLPDASGVTVAFLMANAESLASYMQQLQSGTSRKPRDGCKLTRQSACVVLQRFALDVAQCHRARCYSQHHASCAAAGREMSRKPWPKTSSYVMHRHRKMYSVIVLLQRNMRCHLARSTVRALKECAAVTLVNTSLQVICNRAATRIQLLWRGKVAALTFLDRCSDARFSVQAYTCDRVFKSVIKRFSCQHPVLAATSQAVVVSCVSSIVRSIVRTLEVGRIIPLSEKSFLSSNMNHHEFNRSNDAATSVQKAYRGYVDRWYYKVMREDACNCRSIQQNRVDEKELEPTQYFCSTDEHRHQNEHEIDHEQEGSPRALGAVASGVVGFVETPWSISRACVSIQRCWRGCSCRQRVFRSWGFDVRRHREMLKNLKMAVFEREQHEEYVRCAAGAGRCDHASLEEQSATLQNSDPAETFEEQHGHAESIISICAVGGQLNASHTKIMEVPFNSEEDMSECHMDSISYAIDESHNRPDTYDAALEDSRPKNNLSDDAPPQASVLLIQRLARKWLGRRSLKARRLILWRVRLIVQAAPAALKIQRIFRGHVHRVAFRKLWKWTHDPQPDQSDYSGLPAHFAAHESVREEACSQVKLSEVNDVVILSSSVDVMKDNAAALHEKTLINIMRSMYSDPDTKHYLVKLMLDAPLPVPSTSGRLPAHKLWKHGNDELNIPWLQLNVVPPHMQPSIPADMKMNIRSFSSDPRIPAESDPMLVQNPLATLAQLLSCPYESILEGFSKGTFPLFVQMVEGRCKIVRSSMGIECVQALMIDLGMIRALLSFAHICLESYRHFRHQESPLAHWKSMRGLFHHESESWMWVSSNPSMVKWCLCQDDSSMKQGMGCDQVGFGVVADAMLKRCKACLDMSIFFLRNSCNRFPASCSWVRAWYFSLRGLWYLTNGKQLSALQQMQEAFVELMSSHMRHATSILRSSADTQNTANRQMTNSSSFREGDLDKTSQSMSGSRKLMSARPMSAVSTKIFPSDVTSAPLNNDRKSAIRPISAAASFGRCSKLQDAASNSWDHASLSKIKFSTMDEPRVAALALVFETEAKWYSSVLSAMLCQQGFIFDNLNQLENAKMCFEAAGRMLPLREKVESMDPYEPFLKIILRKRVSAARTSLALGLIPDVFEHIPGLQKSFNDHSITIVSAAESDRAKYMNITGWMAFCAKYKFQVFFPSLIRSKCIGSFMECAKKSYGNTLLLSFADFCSCLLLLQKSGNSTETEIQLSEVARVAAVVKFLDSVEFFILQKLPSLRKRHKLLSSTEETGSLTTIVGIPLLKSVVENESETWFFNQREITVKGAESHDTMNHQSILLNFRVPFEYILSLADSPPLGLPLSSALASLTAKVSSVAFSCVCLKLNCPVLAQQSCLHALQLVDIHASQQPIISRRIIQIFAIAAIQEALCCSEANKAKAFFSRYLREMRIVHNDSKKEPNSDHTSKSTSTSICSHQIATLTTSTSYPQQKSAKSRNTSLAGTSINRPTSKNIQTKGMSDTTSQFSQSLPELPTEIIRKLGLTSSCVDNWKEMRMGKFLR